MSSFIVFYNSRLTLRLTEFVANLLSLTSFLESDVFDQSSPQAQGIRFARILCRLNLIVISSDLCCLSIKKELNLHEILDIRFYGIQNK